MTVHFNVEALPSSVEFQLVVLIDTAATVLKEVDAKNYDLVERGNGWLDDIFITKGVWMVLELKVFPKASRDQCAT